MSLLLKQSLHPTNQKEVDAFKRLKKRFGCALCDKVFEDGDLFRFVYANGTANAHCGNFFVCDKCDGPDVLERGIENYKLAVAGAKRWNIYGPDWMKY